MKLKYFVSGILAAGLMLAANSCQDTLDIPQHSVVSINDFYQTDDEAEEAIVAAYAQFKSVHSGGFFSFNCYQMLMNFLGGDYWSGGNNRTDGTYYQMNEFTFDTNYGTISTLYSGLYTLIYRCNLVIERVEGTSSVMKRAVAEAKTMRAWANFQLVTLWGTAPLVDHVLNPDEYLQGNSESTDVLWKAIEADLNDAISSGALTDKTGTYRITKAFAQAMLGKAQLWQKNYSAAASTFGGIVNSNMFSLRSDLSVVGKITEDVSAEDLFCFRSYDDPSNSGANNIYRGIWTGLRGEKYNTGTFWFYSFGYLSNPTKALYDKFVEIEGVDGYRLNSAIATYDQMKNQYGTTIKDGFTIYDNEGYWDVRYMPRTSNGSVYRYPLPVHVMRYNEVLCLAAEAYFMNNDKDNAAKCINMLRTRAQAPLVSSGSLTLQNIKDESWVELCFEGLRYQNLLRWGDAETYLGHRGEIHPEIDANGNVTYKTYNSAGSVGWKSGKHELLPFPQSEMMVNENMTQNPGW